MQGFGARLEGFGGSKVEGVLNYGDSIQEQREEGEGVNFYPDDPYIWWTIDNAGADTSFTKYVSELMRQEGFSIDVYIQQMNERQDYTSWKTVHFLQNPDADKLEDEEELKKMFLGWKREKSIEELSKAKKRKDTAKAFAIDLLREEPFMGDMPVDITIEGENDASAFEPLAKPSNDTNTQPSADISAHVTPSFTPGATVKKNENTSSKDKPDWRTGIKFNEPIEPKTPLEIAKRDWRSSISNHEDPPVILRNYDKFLDLKWEENNRKFTERRREIESRISQAREEGDKEMESSARQSQAKWFYDYNRTLLEHLRKKEKISVGLGNSADEDRIIQIKDSEKRVANLERIYGFGKDKREI